LNPSKINHPPTARPRRIATLDDVRERRDMMSRKATPAFFG